MDYKKISKVRSKLILAKSGKKLYLFYSGKTLLVYYIMGKLVPDFTHIWGLSKLFKLRVKDRLKCAKLLTKVACMDHTKHLKSEEQLNTYKIWDKTLSVL